MHSVAIVNPQSAGGRTAKTWSQLPSYLRGSLEVLETKSAGHATELAAESLRRGAKIVVAAGGDGTINEVVNGFFDGGRPINPDATLGIIPQGTSSDFIRTVNLPRDPLSAAEIIHAGVAWTIDIANVRYTTMENRSASRYFINIASFGLGGVVATRSRRYSEGLGGKAGFLVSTLLTLARFPGNVVSIQLDDSRTIEAKITNVAIGNGQFHGAGMRVCPRAALDDGMLDVSVIRCLSPYEFIRDLPMLYNGRIYEHAKVEYYRTRHVRANANEPVFMEIDGEPLGKLPLEVSILPGAIRVLVPASLSEDSHRE